MIGTKLRLESKLYLGWFGPRGIGSILYAYTVLRAEEIAEADLIFRVIMITIFINPGPPESRRLYSNFPFYPSDVEVTGIDLSPRMLAKAQSKLSRLDMEISLKEMDVQELDFLDDIFDTVFATFVFCSVPNPIRGLRELRRVCRPGGRLLLLEHMRPEGPIRGLPFDILLMGSMGRREVTLLADQDHAIIYPDLPAHMSSDEVAHVQKYFLNILANVVALIML